jgi:hypothetical protein
VRTSKPNPFRSLWRKQCHSDGRVRSDTCIPSLQPGVSLHEAISPSQLAYSHHLGVNRFRFSIHNDIKGVLDSSVSPSSSATRASLCWLSESESIDRRGDGRVALPVYPEYRDLTPCWLGPVKAAGGSGHTMRAILSRSGRRTK